MNEIELRLKADKLNQSYLDKLSLFSKLLSSQQIAELIELLDARSMAADAFDEFLSAKYP
jgi:hypothetical protein